VLVQPAKEKAHGNGLVCAAAMCFRRDDESLNGAWLHNEHLVSCFGPCFWMDRRGFGREAGELYSELYKWSSAPESPGSWDDADSSLALLIPGESSEGMWE
jgi:hypothetical protein